MVAARKAIVSRWFTSQFVRGGGGDIIARGDRPLAGILADVCPEYFEGCTLRAVQNLMQHVQGELARLELPAIPECQIHETRLELTVPQFRVLREAIAKPGLEIHLPSAGLVSEKAR